MESQILLDIAREAVFVIIKTSFPVMLVGMSLGILMSFIQAITQIQENALSFIPKIFAIFISLLLFSSFIGSALYIFAMKVMGMIAEV